MQADVETICKESKPSETDQNQKRLQNYDYELKKQEIAELYVLQKEAKKEGDKEREMKIRDQIKKRSLTCRVIKHATRKPNAKKLAQAERDRKAYEKKMQSKKHQAAALAKANESKK